MRASREGLRAAGMAQEKVDQLANRKQVRNHRISGRPGKAGKRTGTTPHFAAWKAEGRIKSILQRTKTASLADSLEGRVASAFAVLSVGGVKNVWDVSQASIEQLLAVRGIGLASLGYVEEYLAGKGVQLAWTAKG